MSGFTQQEVTTAVFDDIVVDRIEGITTASPNIKGRTSGGIPVAGDLGNHFRQSVTNPSTTLPASNATKTICSITISPGTWAMAAAFSVDANGLTVSRAQACITDSPTMVGSIFNDYYTEGCVGLVGGYIIGTIPLYCITTAVSLTIDLNTNVTYTGTPAASTPLSGKITAIRIA